MDNRYGKLASVGTDSNLDLKKIITLHEAHRPNEIYTAWLDRISQLVKRKGAGWHCSWTTIEPIKVRYIAFFEKTGEDTEIMVYS